MSACTGVLRRNARQGIGMSASITPPWPPLSCESAYSSTGAPADDALAAADRPTSSAATSGSVRPTSASTFSNQRHQTRPSAPKLTNTASHPRLLMSGGAARSPRIEPTCRPENTKATARERSLGGTTRATMSVAAEGATASPRPTAAREMQRPGIVAARSGTLQVASDQSPTPAGSTLRPPSLELMTPEGSWQSM